MLFAKSKVSCVALILALAPFSLRGAMIFTATLLGSSETPPNASTAFGFATVTLNGDLLTVDETFSGLTGGPASAAHIHCCAPVGVSAGVAVPFTGFPAATSGTYSNTFDLTLLATYNGLFVTANGGTAASAEAAFIAGFNSFQTYANIHNTAFPGGEIRGQIVPEPATTGLVLLGLMSMIVRARRVAKRR